jgi:hypothetical protein
MNGKKLGYLSRFDAEDSGFGSGQAKEIFSPCSKASRHFYLPISDVFGLSHGGKAAGA